MPEWTISPKPADLAENRLLDAILDGSFPINSNLPPERDLATQLGVTRPTLREALQRLSRDGWIEIHHGKSTRVCDYWREGNLLILKALSDRPDKLPDCLIPDLLHLRAAVAPLYAKRALSLHPQETIDLLTSLQDLEDSPLAYAQADQALHQRLANLSDNVIYPLLLNNFRKVSIQAGLLYFGDPSAREVSREFYRNCLQAAKQGDCDQLEAITRAVMLRSIRIWSETQASEKDCHE
ncbi:MAG TPA: fatty acid metabolism transcriptional regulator FadR [Anaerolineaceae bacterium]|nr:fatty acid metabolism transcriptional regulator FadR [Anaerolineaceae bacterium]